MYKYKVQVKKVSGSLNESVLPNKNLVIKSKTEKSNEQLFAEASEYYKNKYGLVIESADVMSNNHFDVNTLKNIADKILSNPKILNALNKFSSTYSDDRTEKLSKKMAKELGVNFTSLSLDEYKLFKQVAKSALAKYE